MLTQELRRKFLKYFKEKGHAIVPSSPVVPYDDPTLLFSNAGMNQFKDVFLGKSKRDYHRAVTSQKCIRAGGKHNDLDNVGHTSRHLTFFEMLGNFSFGDYFKKEAIQFAWEVSTQVFGLNPDRIWPTVFRDDDEAFDLWTAYVPADRITRFGEKENFWAMGDVGPCGPCSELLYDRGPAYGTAKSPLEDTSGERYLEFWNLVFMQYNRTGNGQQESLPKPSIDTGAGLERIVSLKMEVDTVFETDVLRSLISQVEVVSGRKYDLKDPVLSPAFRVIADHLRCLSFAIADGVQPSNVDRGYVLRKVLRRAVRYGRVLGLEEPFLGKVLPKLVETMGPDYPELKESQERIREILTHEEEAFLRTLRRGGNLLSQVVERAKAHQNAIAGDDAFKLKDTYGLPLEEILLIAKDTDLTVDLERYQQLEQEAKERSRSSQKTTQQIAGESIFADYAQKHGTVNFVGYTQSKAEAKVTGLVVEGKFVSQISSGQEALVLLDQTPFYAEMGGQVGDTGTLKSDHAYFRVNDCLSPYKGIYVHKGILEEGVLHVGDRISANVDHERRLKIANNHTATHLLHWALNHVLGEHVRQAGSVVDPSRLRFDFNHHKALTPLEIREIEDLINRKIRQNLPVEIYEIPYEEAQRKREIKQFFGEKYNSQVRVVDIDFSKELCGGTHVNALGTIGLFRIIKEGSVAAGVRRIEAVTGEEAELFCRNTEDYLARIASLLKVQPHQLAERVERLSEDNNALQQELKALKKEQLSSSIDQLLTKVERGNRAPFLVAQINVSPEELRAYAESAIERLPSGVVVLATEHGGRGHLIVRVSDDLVSKISANEIVKAVAPIIEGSGGGKPNSAQAGGKAPQHLPAALAKVRELI